MEASSEPVYKIRRQAFDVPTALLALVLILAPIFLVLLQKLSLLHWSLAIILGSLSMNLSFAAWHEAAHENFSKYRWVNLIFGWVCSLASVYPGYFARRREHLIHHKWEGQAGYDPVVERLHTASWITFPWKLFKVNFISRPVSHVPDAFCPYTSIQRLSDAVSNCCAASIVLGAFFLDLHRELLTAWIIPRFVIFWAHAYYVCFFPHHVGEDGYTKFRVRNTGPLLRVLTVNQNFHGIHHRWPFIPWHQYGRILQHKRNLIDSNKIEVI